MERRPCWRASLGSGVTYGIWALGLATLAGAIGVPVPTSMLLLAAGAFARQGVLDWQWAVALAGLGTLCMRRRCSPCIHCIFCRECLQI